MISALTFKIGIVQRKFIDQLSEKRESLKGAFSNSENGFALFSQGFKRHQTTSISNQPKICKGFAPGDVVSFVFDSIKGSVSFFVNKEFGSVLFVDEKFKTEEFYPAIAILGEGEQIRLTYLE